VGLAALLAGCSEGAGRPRSPGVDTLSSGRIVVTAGSTLAAGVAEASLVPIASLGDVASEDSVVFGRIVDVALSRDGRTLYVADAYDNSVRAFSLTGRLLGRWGRHGEGPGEFTGITGIEIDSDGTLWIMDPGNLRLTGFPPGGDTLVAPSVQDGWSTTIPWLGRFAYDGALLDLLIRPTRSVGRHSLVKAVLSDGVTDHIRVTPLPNHEPPRYGVSRGGITQRAIVPFAPSRRIAIGPSGHIWISDDVAYLAHRIAGSGDTTLTVSKLVNPPGISEAARDSASRATGLSRQEIPEVRQAIERMVVDSEGRLWVASLPGATERERTWDVWTDQGLGLSVSSTIGFDLEVVPPVVVGSTVAGVVTDELGRQSVAVARIVMRGDSTTIH
jgi:hypothetical protein